MGGDKIREEELVTGMAEEKRVLLQSVLLRRFLREGAPLFGGLRRRGKGERIEASSGEKEESEALGRRLVEVRVSKRERERERE